MDVVGWSLGGLVAQELCCVAPSEVRRAVLASTSPGGDDLAELISRDFFDVFDGWADDDTREGEAAAARRRRGVRPRPPERWVSNNVDALKADVDAFVGVRRAAPRDPRPGACALAPFPDCSRLPEQRYLVLHGDVDPVVDAALAARLAERAPGAAPRSWRAWATARGRRNPTGVRARAGLSTRPFPRQPASRGRRPSQFPPDFGCIGA